MIEAYDKTNSVKWEKNSVFRGFSMFSDKIAEQEEFKNS